MRARLQLAALASLLLGCWIDFPHSRYGPDGGDGGAAERGADSARGDGGAKADSARGDGGSGCVDQDGDGFTTCDGDCDDSDPDVRPDQTAFFSSAAGGGFDYDCDGREELQHPHTSNCQVSGDQCSGEGWAATIPACGATGVFDTCVRRALLCVPQPATRVQACR